ncbi:MAG: N-6 DNA methylase, partial [Candidatus Kapabacteria bacterium]|nr:N-6 DNA methylase [Candidatus Kapabacteria bacterium]
RHSLGEYYTPDWLCERIVSQFNFKESDKILDPACGSGSFLRAIVHRIRDLHPNLSAEEINQMIFGIDIHPLSVQISKTTLLLSLGQEITKAKKPIHLNIILANTLLAPEGVTDLFGTEFTLQIDKEKYQINTQVLDDIEEFDLVLDLCQDLADQTFLKKSFDISNFESILKKHLTNNGINSQIVDSYYKIYIGLKNVKEKGRDSIWKFIISNLYKPYFLYGKFSYVIGNPPWFTYSSIKNEEYQIILDKLATKYLVKPKKIANYPHLEIAAIFQAYCSSYFLREHGKIAFVLPRSFLTADHHDNSRSGFAKGFQISEIWDLGEVSPLFRIPSCVFFSEKSDNGKKTAKNEIRGIKIKGKLPYHNCHYDVAVNYLTEKAVSWHYSVKGNSSALTTMKTKTISKVNPYKNKFKQGATIVPRAFYFVDLDQNYPDDFIDRILSIKTSKFVKSDGKPPWKGLDFAGRIESKFLFRTALSKSILPFHLFKPDLVVLPIIINIDENGKKTICVHSAEELLRMGELKASRWFSNVENIWNIKKTQKSRNMGAYDRINFHSGLSSQDLNARYLVLYNASAKDANALVLDRKDLDLEFIVESKTYVFYTNNIAEGYYLSSVLNSSITNTLIKDFQTRGLFGPRDIHKKILDVYFPKFDKNNKSHKKLSDLAKIGHLKAKDFIKNNPPQEELTPLNLGKLRLQIKNHLIDELKEIDKIVNKLIQ